MAKNKGQTTEVAGVRFTSPDRVVYPDAGVTKLELAQHYLQATPRLLPHIRARPVTMIRCPDTFRDCFFQKHIDDAAHYQGVKPVWLKEGRGRGRYASIEDPAGLIALVQLGVVEFHTPGIRADKLTHPDRFILDLDPDPEVEWPAVVEAARALRALLQEMGIESWVKTTGGKGLHVVAPVRRTQTTERVLQFTEAIAALFERVAPDRYTTNVSKAQRKGKILIDYLRNAPGATAVEVYSARARPGAPVAVPLRWEELGDNPVVFDIRTTKERLASLRADPWEGFFEVRQAITAKARRQVGV